jgi:hypothetical protein
MCNHDFSSNWYEDSEKLYPGSNKERTKVMKVSDNIVDDLIPHLNKVKSFYFAGGEPLIMPEHYKVLKHLYDNLPIRETGFGQKRNLSIHYNTNLSVITYDEKSLIDLWEGFDRVFLSISCDGVGKVGEYQRVGFQHDRFVENLKNIKKYFKAESPYLGGFGLLYNFQYTTTIWNVYHIFDFIEFMKSNSFIESSDHIDFYYAWSPNDIALNNISETEKSKVIKFLEEGIKKIESSKTILEINNLINFIKSKPNIENNIELVVEYTKKLDSLHNTDANSLQGIDFQSMILEK